MLSRLALAAVVLPLATLPTAAQPKPTAPPPTRETPTRPPDVAPELADWTPRPATGKAEPWEKATDKDWVDGRFRDMDTGPFFDATFQYPLGKRKAMVYKGTAIRFGGETSGGVLFDRNSLRLVAAWAGKYLTHTDRRFGLLNTPGPAGSVLFAVPPGPGWADPDGSWEAKNAGTTTPLPKAWAKYRGLHVHGDRVVFQYTVGGVEVLDAPRLEHQSGQPMLSRTLSVGPRQSPLRLAVPAFATVSGADRKPGTEVVEIPAGSVPRTVTIRYAAGPPAEPEDVAALTKPGPARWGQPLVTKFARGDDSGPFAIDTLTIPYDNPFKALFFCTGLDFLPDHRIAVSTCHGDVWLVTLDEARGTCSWQRFATGLYHPLGLKVVDGQVVVLERGQLTRLHDQNGDGEADFYECLNNDWDTGAGEHSYDTCLETDPQGNFYFFKTGDTQLPTGGCLMKVTKDGSKSEVVATGFRHPIGLGASPTGIITGADQEGNWMPATRIDEYRPGGFYGDMRAHHRATPPKTYDGPLCWVPREVDNSAGGQVWVPETGGGSEGNPRGVPLQGKGAWGPLGGLPLHLSYGRCKAFVLLRQPYADGSQGGVWDLGLKFLSGVCRGRFDPSGMLYVCGLNGWQTSAQADGCLQRVRPTGKPLNVPVKLEVVPDGVNLTFSRPLDPTAAVVPDRYRAAWWNYKWSGEYGSQRYKVSTGEVGQDDIPITAARLLDDGRTVHVLIPGMRPVMQMQLGVNLKAADGTAAVGSVFLTVHRTGK